DDALRVGARFAIDEHADDAIRGGEVALLDAVHGLRLGERGDVRGADVRPDEALRADAARGVDERGEALVHEGEQTALPLGVALGKRRGLAGDPRVPLGGGGEALATDALEGLA